jgi:hypothetical protein
MVSMVLSGVGLILLMKIHDDDDDDNNNNNLCFITTYDRDRPRATIVPSIEIVAVRARLVANRRQL